MSKNSREKLARKICTVIHGESYKDIATVCSLIVGISISNGGMDFEKANRAAIKLIKQGYDTPDEYVQ